MIQRKSNDDKGEDDNHIDEKRIVLHGEGVSHNFSSYVSLVFKVELLNFPTNREIAQDWCHTRRK